MSLVRWSYASPYGFTLRGYHSLPSGKPLLHMLHGNGFCSQVYWPLLELLQNDFDLFLSDVQGHGDSDAGDQFIGWNGCADLAAAAFRQHQALFGNVDVYAVGHSFGGVLTALINSQANSPFAKTVLLDPVLFTPPMLAGMQLLQWLGWYKNNPLAKQALKRRQHWSDRQQSMDYFQNRGMFKGWHESALASYIEHALHHQPHQITLKCPPQREADVFGSFPTQLWHQLKQPCSDTLLLYGDRSYPFVSKAAKRWAKYNSAVQTDQLKGGHCFMLEDPIPIAARIREFLRPNSKIHC